MDWESSLNSSCEEPTTFFKRWFSRASTFCSLRQLYQSEWRSLKDLCLSSGMDQGLTWPAGGKSSVVLMNLPLEKNCQSGWSAGQRRLEAVGGMGSVICRLRE